MGLKLGSIPTRNDVVNAFSTKYFHEEETKMLATLQGTKQRSEEDLMEYIKRFRDKALNCYDHCNKKMLVELCIGNMIMEYMVVLKILEISQFAQLLQKAKKMIQSIKPNSDKLKEQKFTPQAMTVSISKKRKKLEGREYKSLLLIPCTPKELAMLLDRWIIDGVFKLNHLSKEPTEEEWRDLHFCRLHNYVQHATAECWALHKLVHPRIKKGTLELAQLEVQRNPFSNH